MSETSPAATGFADPREQEHLEAAHHEMCTVLTVLQSNVDLVRVELRREIDPAVHVVIQRHLTELDLAVERLKRLAGQMRTWHAGDPIRAGPNIRAAQNTRILP